jgi:1-deoxy-D-xylulose-5-phosphate synthase
MLHTATLWDDGAIALRYPRGEAEGVPIPTKPRAIEVGRGEVLREGDRVALLGYGFGVPLALRAAALLEEHDLDVTVADARFAKPLDAELVSTLAAEHELIVTLEDGVVQGGFGSAVAELMMDRDLASDTRLLRVGLPDRFVTHGKPALLHQEVGLTPEAVVERVLEAVGSHSRALA